MQRKQLRVRDQEQRVLERVPLTDGREDGDRGKNRCDQRHDDLQEDREIAGSVDLRRFLQGDRRRLDERFDKDDIERSNDPRYDIDQEIVYQAKLEHDKEPWNQPGIKIHGHDKEPVPEFTSPHYVFRKQVSEKSRYNHGQQCANQSASYRYERGCTQSGNLEYFNIVVYMNPSRVKHHEASAAQVVVANRIDEQIIERKKTSQSEKRKPRIIQDVKYRNLSHLSHVDTPLFSQ